MNFRSWVRDHAGQSVRVEWQNFNRASGGARVVLIGFDEGAEDDYPDGVLLALLALLARWPGSMTRRPIHRSGAGGCRLLAVAVAGLLDQRVVRALALATMVDVGA